MKYYTVSVRLSGALTAAVAVEWTNQAAPVDSGQGWQPCLRLDSGAWRFSSHAPFGATPPHKRDPGAFGALAIRYRLSASGPWSVASPLRKEVVILDVTETGTRRDPGFAPRATAPMLVLAPGLIGAGRIGTEVSVAPGLWGGDPAPALTFQWRRGGVAIPGAVARAYAPVAADDLTDLDCVVRAANASGASTAVTTALRVTYPAPAVFGALPEEVFDEDTGAQVVETAFAFAGASLAFSAVGGAIDARTGALTLPTDAPVSGRRVTVTATNSGGAVSATFVYTVEAAPAPRALGASDVRILRSDWRPAGQTRSFTPRIAFPGLAGETGASIQFSAPPIGYAGPELWFPAATLPGETGVWQLPDAVHPTLPGFNAAVFENDARRLGRLRFRWRPAAGTVYSDASSGFDAPLPAGVDLAAFKPTSAEIANAMNAPLFRYAVSSTDPHGPGCNEGFSGHYPVVQTMAALTGDTASYTSGSWTGGKTAAQRVLDQLVFWGSATAQNAPTAEGGFKAQTDLAFAATVAIARNMPAIWNAASLTAAIKTRLDLAMKGLLVGSVFATSPKNPWYQAGFGAGRDRGLRGYSANVSGVPNFALPPRLIPFVVAQYMGAGGADGPALAHAFLEGFSRSAFASAIQAAWGNTTSDLYKTFAADWDSARQAAMFPAAPTVAFGRGPTAAEIEACCRGYKCMGQWTLDQAREIAQYAINACFQRPIVPGATRAPSGWTGGESGPAPFNTGLYGVRVATTDNLLDGCLGRLVGGVFDKSSWADLPNAFEPHMASELDTTDGGGKDDSGNFMPHARSSMAYTHKGVNALLIGVTALATYGALEKDDAGWPAIRIKLSKGITDLKYRDQHGHRDYAKGGVGSENSDWNMTYATTTKNHRMPSRYATAHAILAHLGA